MTDFIIDHAPAPTVDDLTIKIATLEAEVKRLDYNWNAAQARANDYFNQIEGVRGYIMDMVSAGDKITSEIKDIADLLGIEMTKTISGTAVYEISWSATVPLDFDADSMEISFDVECESYEAEDFDWNEDNCEVNGSDD